jgi:hypothetical protein
MRKRVNIVVTCTKRKRFPLAPGLQMREVLAADRGNGFANWIERLSTSDAETVLARNLYAGEHWSIVRSLEDVAASSGLEATVWICSAGYGLIGLDSRIKPYSATFASNHADTVCKWRDGDTGETDVEQCMVGHPDHVAGP